MAKKSNSEWWAKRQEEKYLAGEKSVDKYYKDLVSSLEEAQAEIQDTLDTFYARYMSENRLSNYAEAQKLLNKTELNGLKDFIERAQKSLGVYDRELNNISLKARITRYDALKARVDTILQKVYAIDYEEMSIQELKKIYEDTYYKTIYRLDQKRGCHCEFTKLNANAFNEVITYPFNGADFSSRLWKQKDHLLQQLNESITTMLVQGRSPGTLSKDFAKKFKTKKHEAYRLLHTEASYVMEQANQKAYDEDGVEEYEWIATLDSSTCDVCAPKDGEVYKVGKGIACDTLPPAHCFCRCTTAPYFDDDYEEDEERFARDEDGNPIQVPDDMTYSEWKKKYVKNNVEKNGKSDIIKPTKVISGHKANPRESNAFDIIDHLGEDGKTETRTFYNGKGEKAKDITNHNHKMPKTHPYGTNGEHAHDYTWENGELIGRTTRELTETERKENRNIL